MLNKIDEFFGFFVEKLGAVLFYKIADFPVVVITSKDLTKDDYDTLRGDVIRIVQKGSYKSDEILEYVNRIIRNKK